MSKPGRLAEAVRPRDWGAEVDYDAWTDTYTQDDKIIVHYNGPAVSGFRDGRAREETVMRNLEHFHKHTKGWRGLAYGWAIGMSGTIYAVRQWNSYGAHKGDLDRDGIPENSEGIPVLFLIGDGQDPTQEAIDAFGRLRAFFEGELGKSLPLFGHQEVAKLGTGTSTSCPGSMMAMVNSQRDSSPVGGQPAAQPSGQPAAPPAGLLALGDLTEAEWTWVAQHNLIAPPTAGPYYAKASTARAEKEHAAVVAIRNLVAKDPAIS